MTNEKKIIIPIVAVFIIILGGWFLVYNNPKALYVIAEGLDEPSSSYYHVAERIYYLSTNESEIKRILNELDSGKNEHLHEQYVRTIGIVGENSDFANHILISIYSKYQDSDQRKSIVFSVIDSMGFIGNNSTISVLKRLIENYDSHRIMVAKYPLARALYLATGDIHLVREISKTDFIETNELKMARETLVHSIDRYRTIDEMLILANLNRPSKYKTHVN